MWPPVAPDYCSTQRKARTGRALLIRYSGLACSDIAVQDAGRTINRECQTLFAKDRYKIPRKVIVHEAHFHSRSLTLVNGGGASQVTDQEATLGHVVGHYNRHTERSGSGIGARSSVQVCSAARLARQFHGRPVCRVDDHGVRRVAGSPQGVLGAVDGIRQVVARGGGIGGEVARVGQAGQVRGVAVAQQQLTLDALGEAVTQSGVNVAGDRRGVGQELVGYLNPVRYGLDRHVVLLELSFGFRFQCALSHLSSIVRERCFTQRVHRVGADRNGRDALTDGDRGEIARNHAGALHREGGGAVSEQGGQVAGDSSVLHFKAHALLVPAYQGFEGVGSDELLPGRLGTLVLRLETLLTLGHVGHFVLHLFQLGRQLIYGSGQLS